MSAASPFSVVEPWDLVAEGYAAEADAVMAPFSLRAAKLAKLDAHAHVVDVAAGPGTLALQLAARVASVTAVDFSAEMNARLQAQAERCGYSNVRVVQADGQALPLPDASFDAGFSMFGALRAADETFVTPTYNPDSLENPERLASELRAGGFLEVSVQEHTAGLAFDDVDTLWSRMTRSSAPLVSLRKRLGEPLWRERSELARAYLARELGGGPLALSTTAWLGHGVRPQL